MAQFWFPKNDHSTVPNHVSQFLIQVMIMEQFLFHFRNPRLESAVIHINHPHLEFFLFLTDIAKSKLIAEEYGPKFVSK